MILNNYWNFIIGATNQSYYVTQGTESVTTSFGCKNTSGMDLAVAVGGYGVSSNEELGNAFLDQIREHSLLDAIVGSGDTDPTPTDYDLDTDITSSITNYAASANISADANGLHTVITVSGQNNTGSSITIAEIGVIKWVHSVIYHRSDEPMPDPDNKCLFVRHVLDSPKTVPNGEGFNLTFEWTEA